MTAGLGRRGFVAGQAAQSAVPKGVGGRGRE